MKRCLLILLSIVCFFPVFSQGLFSGSLKDADPVFDRPDEGMPPTTISAISTNVHYNLISVEVTTAGLITFSSNSVWDNFMILYSPGGFDPASPLTNALLANDDFSGPNAGFTYNFTVPGTYYLVICSFKNNVTGSFTVSTSPAVVLPLKLISFTAGKTSGGSNIIKWTSAEELNISSYQVQRSTDNTNFKDLKNASITAKNNPSGSTYSFIDNSPASGYNYYRLKIAERSGHISYSPVALVKNIKIGINDLHIFPNPASDFLKIEVKSMQNKRAAVSVINSIGAIMNTGQYNFNSEAVLSIDIKRLPAGKYFLRTIIGNEKATVSFIKN